MAEGLEEEISVVSRKYSFVFDFLLGHKVLDSAELEGILKIT